MGRTNLLGGAPHRGDTVQVKRQKTRCTSQQLDAAILSQIDYAKQRNINKNALSNALSFCELVANQLFGANRPAKERSPGYLEAVKDAFQQAAAERAEYALKAQRQAEEERRKVIVPGDPRFRN
jgi:hypothetical protein